MAIDIAQAKETIRRCREFRDVGRPEAVLRSEIQSRLRLIFPSPEDETWINHWKLKAAVAIEIRIGSNRESFT
jgi:hypothetical protein